jgi:hypothetical protein
VPRWTALEVRHMRRHLKEKGMFTKQDTTHYLNGFRRDEFFYEGIPDRAKNTHSGASLRI